MLSLTRVPSTDDGEDAAAGSDYTVSAATEDADPPVAPAPPRRAKPETAARTAARQDRARRLPPDRPHRGHSRAATGRRPADDKGPKASTGAAPDRAAPAARRPARPSRWLRIRQAQDSRPRQPGAPVARPARRLQLRQRRSRDRAAGDERIAGLQLRARARGARQEGDGPDHGPHPGRRHLPRAPHDPRRQRPRRREVGQRLPDHPEARRVQTPTRTVVGDQVDPEHAGRRGDHPDHRRCSSSARRRAEPAAARSCRRRARSPPLGTRISW